MVERGQSLVKNLVAVSRETPLFAVRSPAVVQLNDEGSQDCSAQAPSRWIRHCLSLTPKAQELPCDDLEHAEPGLELSET